MIRTTDGSGQYKRLAGVGDKIPVLGVSPTVITYVATGGETSINLAAQVPPISYKPGAHQLKVRRSSGGGELFAGIDYTETSTTAIGFAAGDALIAGEIVEIELKFAATGVMAIAPRPDCYTATATAGQTTVTADFSWTYNINAGKSIGGVKVYVQGFLWKRGVEYTEVNLGTVNTNQILVADGFLGGEDIVILPAYQAIDDAGASTQFNNSRLTNIQSMMSAGTQAFVDQSTDMIAVPNTTIVGRAKIPNLANDLRASLGVDRIPIQAAVQLQNEFGPEGQPVYAAVNDDRGLLRFVGKWTSGNSSEGPSIYDNSGLITDFTEIVFYGTGLNVLFGYQDVNDRGFSAIYVDGISTGSLAFTGSNVLSSRNYSPNFIKAVCSNLSLGVHTVRMMNVTPNTVQISGFEILNSNASGYININTGTAYANGTKIVKSAASAVAYNTGVTGTRGGRVVRYLSADGTVSQAVTLVNAAAAYLTSADHTNEEVARPYNWREFGAGRADDFSLLSSSARAAAFTLDDGTTTLVVSSGIISDGDYVTCNGGSDYFVFTFVGTGLDIVALLAGTYTFVVSVDGTSVGSTATGTTLRTIKLVSGLPYGTHTVKLACNGVVGTPRLRSLIVYGPKKPAIPATAVELCDYNVMATYIANNTASIENVAQGVLKKHNTREVVYVNGTGGDTDWTFSLDPLIGGGWGIATNRLNASVSYTFFGTGAELRFTAHTNRTSNASVFINNSLATTGNFPTLVSSVYGTGVTFSSGVLDQNDATTTFGCGLSISGLPLGVYTIKLNHNASSAYMDINMIDIITPIHAVKSNLYADLQNTLPVGSCSLTDSRKTSMVKEILPAQKAWAQAVGVSSSPTTSSTSLVPIADMSLTIRTDGGPLQVSFAMPVQHTQGSADIEIRTYVDGVLVDSGCASLYIYPAAANLLFLLADTFVTPVAKGIHKVDLYWRCGSGNLAALSARRHLTVQEL